MARITQSHGPTGTTLPVEVQPDGGVRSDAPIQDRRLSRVAGPLLLWGLGVGYVVSGDYYGWNFGLGTTGYWGFLVALGIMGLLYATMCAAIAEMAAAIPHAGGPYAFVRMAIGKTGGYITGVGVLIEYVVAPSAVAIAIGAYIQAEIVDIPIVVAAIGVYILSTAVHYFGAGGSLKVELALTAVAIVGLVMFYAVGVGEVSKENLNAVGDGDVFPNGFSGLWAALPLAAWFFLAIEALPMASEETRNPAKDMPKALATSWITLAVLAVLTLTIAAGMGGADTVGEADAPLPVAIAEGLGAGHWAGDAISWIGLAGLGASFHAIVLAYSRQTFALSRAGYLPRFLSAVSPRRTPSWALVIPGLIGAALVVLADALSGSAIPVLVTMAVFGAAISYIMMMASFIVLRRRRPDLERPFKAPGGQLTALIGLVLACVLLPAGMKDFPEAMLFASLTFLAFVAYYLLHSRHTIVTDSMEEELAMIAQAESELKG